MKSGSNIQYEPCIFRRPLLPEDVPTFVTVQTVPCTSLHGIGADEVMVSGHLVFAPLRSVLNMRHWSIAPLAAGDF